MEITEVRIKLMEDSDDRLQAFCSITFDNCFVIRDLKIIEGTSGPFVAMPSRKLTAHCPRCGFKNHLRASYCSHCGLRQNEDRAIRDDSGRTKLYADIAHPINSLCREMIQARVIAEFRHEMERAKQPGYVSRYDDDYDDDFEPHDLVNANGANVPAPAMTQFEPPASEPRAPHRLPAASEPGENGTEGMPGPHFGKAKPPASQPRARSGFGAGIFEQS